MSLKVVYIGTTILQLLFLFVFEGSDLGPVWFTPNLVFITQTQTQNP